MGEKTEAVVAIILMLGGFGYFLAATQYPIGAKDNPGPGLLPRSLGIIFVLLSAYLLATHWPGRGSKTAQSPSPKSQSFELKAPLQVVILLILYVAALSPLGFVLSTFLAILFTARFMGLEGWIRPVLLGVGTVALAYLLFVSVLDVPLPVGAIWEGMR